MLDKAADLVKQEKYTEAMSQLIETEKEMARWVERHLSPCEKSG